MTNDSNNNSEQACTIQSDSTQRYWWTLKLHASVFVNVSITQRCPFSRRKLVSLTGTDAREIARRRTYYARLRWLFSLMYSRRWPGRVINTEESTGTPLRSSRWAMGKAMTPGPSRDPRNSPQFLRAHMMSKRVNQHGIFVSFSSFCILHRHHVNNNSANSKRLHRFLWHATRTNRF